MKPTSAATFTALQLLGFTSALLKPDSVSRTIVWSLSDIQPSPSFNWTPCWANFTCALLQVPLDYADPSAGTTNVPFIRTSSSNASAQDVLFNPGGPGASGFDFVLGLDEKQRQELLGPQWNLVGFDPRGVKSSDINLDCFPGNREDDALFQSELGGHLSDYTSLLSLHEAWELGRGLGERFVDGDDYYAGGSRTSQMDANEAASTFFTYCFEAGPDRCAFYGNASGPDKIEQRFSELLTELREHPIVVSDPELTQRPTLIGWKDLRSLFMSVLYDALGGFPDFAATLVELEQHDATSFFKSTRSAGVERPLNDTIRFYDGGQTYIQIMCADTNGRFNVSTFEQYVALDNYLRQQSFYGGDGNAIIYAICRGLDIKPPRSQVLNGTVSANQTSSPILFMSSTLDPVTPLRSAKTVSSRFGGSALLTVERTGVRYS
ncbi:hypothetical protein LTS18_008158 [Coniosporium uncinatum]|uniref:Uncharacterized protein n=1 Tax=Coniosporium uncinatum TaxID=93489 RepID=A0ACC3DYV9_9PEZI|nr:hypothetical protein LTS18_008158 [Coniosporium uncinatum]